MNKPVYLDLSILELCKIVMQDFWHGCIKAKYGEKPNLCHIDIASFIVYKKAEDIYADIAKNVETRFHTLNYELARPLPKGKNKVIGLMKDELGEKIKRVCPVRPKT